MSADDTSKKSWVASVSAAQDGVKKHDAGIGMHTNRFMDSEADRINHPTVSISDGQLGVSMDPNTIKDAAGKWLDRRDELNAMNAKNVVRR